MRHRRLEPICGAELLEAIARVPLDHHVVWTGAPCASQAGSMRSRALACITEVGRPVTLRVVLQRAADVEAGAGFNPDAVRSAVRLHQAARPAAYLLVRRTAAGFVAVADIPFPAGGSRRIAAGDLVMDPTGRLLLDRAGPATPLARFEGARGCA